jgi:hypothetical protein
MLLSTSKSRLFLISISLVIAGFWGFSTLGFSKSDIDTNPEIYLPPKAPVDYKPIRGAFNPLQLKRGGFAFKCSECHKVFASSLERKSLNAEHTDLKLNHGRNDHCFNCHHIKNRDAYTAHDGSEIPSSQPVQLCSKCHGLIYRDWQSGAHGRITGYWDAAKGEQSKVLCIQCHDPHSPAFPKIAPMPGPEVHAQKH